MVIYLGILLFSLCIFIAAFIPFIDFLYKHQFIYKLQVKTNRESEFKLFSEVLKSQKFKIGTPIGGGFLIIALITILYPLIFPLLIKAGIFINASHPIKEELNIIFFTFISFGLLGLYSDIKSNWKHRLISKFILSLFCGFLLYFNLGIDWISLPLFGVIKLGLFYPLFSGLTIFVFSRAFNITDGFDGLAVGNLIISLFGLWAISVSIFDTPISVFISLWLSGLIVFLYFNIFPARIWLGNMGALSFGATFALLGLILGKIAALWVIGGLFVIEFLSWLLQKLSLVIRRKKLFSIIPLHYLLYSKGWPEPKIVMRSWLIGIVLVFVGLWLS